MLNGLDLFSGIGGISIALKQWVRTVAYCEIDRYCQGVILSRIKGGELENAPIWDDIKTLDGSRFSRGYIDIIFGGFPCQDISVAGRGKGLEGERSGLFFEIMRLAKEIKPPFLFLENVPAITSRGGVRVVTEIVEMGYDCRWCVISAASVGALHKRERWFLLAYSKRNGGRSSSKGHRLSTQPTQLQPENGKACSDNDKTICGSVSDSGCACKRLSDQSEWASSHLTGCSRIWEVEPGLGRVAYGIPFRVDELRALGNAVVPQQAKEAFKILMGLKK